MRKLDGYAIAFGVVCCQMTLVAKNTMAADVVAGNLFAFDNALVCDVIQGLAGDFTGRCKSSGDGRQLARTRLAAHPSIDEKRTT